MIEWGIHGAAWLIGLLNWLVHLDGARFLDWPSEAMLRTLPFQPAVEDMLSIPRQAPYAAGFREFMAVILIYAALTGGLIVLATVRLLLMRPRKPAWITAVALYSGYALSALYWFGENNAVWRDEGRFSNMPYWFESGGIAVISVILFSVALILMVRPDDLQVRRS